MKFFFIALFIVSTSSLSAKANQECYDEAIGYVEGIKNALIGCNASFDTKKFDRLNDQIENWSKREVRSGKYQKRVVNSLGALYPIFNSNLPEQATTNPCLQTIVKEWKDLRASITDALVMCTNE